VRLWDARTGRLKGSRAAGPGAIGSVALSPDSKTLATSSPWSDPTLWDYSTGRALRTFRERPPRIPGGPLAFSAGGQVLAGSTGTGQVVFWDPATGRRRPHHFETTADSIRSTLWQPVRFALAPDGRSLAAAISNTGEREVVLWDAVTGKERRVLAPRGLPGGFAPEGGGGGGLGGGAGRVGDVEGRGLHACEGDAKRASRCAFSPDGRTLATAGETGVVHLWELATGKRRRSFTGHEGRVNVLLFSPDGRRLASGGADHTVLVWALTGRARRLTVHQQKALWADLGGPDAARAYKAILDLAGAPAQALPLLAGRLRPLEPADAREVGRLLAALGSDDFGERERASAVLE